MRGQTPDDAARTARQLRLNELELYTQTERFIFELIQNADDMPKSDKGVAIEFMLKRDFFIFLHNGLPFRSDNVDAIADAGKSTKIADSQKTGYKGIGFKSVFSDARAVYIHSGAFSFRFDQDYYKGIKFDQLYEAHLSDLHPAAKRNFLARYKDKEADLVLIENIPWQIKPIWTDYREYPEELRNIRQFFQEEVAVALKIGQETIINKNYDQILKDLFTEPRFLLFLRHVNHIGVRSDSINLQVEISTSEHIRTIKSHDWDTGDVHQDMYITENGNNIIGISNESFSKVGVPIMLIPDEDKMVFKKTDGSDLHNIPEKLARLTHTTISFAARIEKMKVVKLADAEAILFNYLPTNDTRFGFPFLVNADFITTTNRETIIQENLWNVYLFFHIGYNAIRWIAETAQRSTGPDNDSLRNSILGLLPKLQADVKDIHQKFNAGYLLAVNEIAFIPAAFQTKLLKAGEAVIDRTGIFKKEFFHKSFKELFPLKELVSYDLLYLSEKLCDPELYGFEVEVFDETGIWRLFGLESFSPKTNSYHNATFIRMLNQNKHVEALKNFPSLLSRGQVLKRPDELFILIDQDDEQLVTFDEQLHFVSNDLERLAVKHPDFSTILTDSLGVRKFDPVNYVQTILPQTGRINKVISNTDANKKFWRFIFKHRRSIGANDKARLDGFAVATTENGFIPLNECYLSSQYETTYQIEDVALQIGLSNLTFVSPEFVLASKEIDDWRSLFYECGARKSEGWELYRLNVKAIINNNQLSESNCLIITRFVFSVYRNNRSKFDLAENNVLKKLRLLTDKNGLQPAIQCFFYARSEPETLPDYAIDNLVSDQYQAALDRITGQDWIVFLRATGVTELDDADVIKKKFLKIASPRVIISTEQALIAWQFIFANAVTITIDSVCRQKLKDIPLPLKDATLAGCKSTCVYLSNEYFPVSDMETLLGNYYNKFVSAALIVQQSDAEPWRDLLAMTGARETIAADGNGNNFEIGHIEYLMHYDFALRFWTYFQQHFKVDGINTNSKFRLAVTSQSTIPCLDGGMRRPDEVFPNKEWYKEQINDDSRIAACEFADEVLEFLGINTSLAKLESDNSYLKHLGNLGERFVYEELKREQALDGLIITEHEFGFRIGPAEKPIAEITWNNKMLITADIRTLLDSGMPYDFVIKTEGVTDFIEVKTTFLQNSHFMMPESEWNCMLANPKNYYIYRVNNVGSSPNISVRCLALDALLTGNIRPLDFPLTISM